MVIVLEGGIFVGAFFKDSERYEITLLDWDDVDDDVVHAQDLLEKIQDLPDDFPNFRKDLVIADLKIAIEENQDD